MRGDGLHDGQFACYRQVAGNDFKSLFLESMHPKKMGNDRAGCMVCTYLYIYDVCSW